MTVNPYIRKLDSFNSVWRLKVCIKDARNAIMTMYINVSTSINSDNSWYELMAPTTEQAEGVHVLRARLLHIK